MMKTEETKELEKMLGITDAEEREIPSVNTYEDAEKAMDTYASAGHRILERTAFVRTRVEMVMNRLDQLNAEDEKKQKRAAEVLKEWGEGFVKKTKSKTIKMIHGQMSFKDVPEAVVVDDAEKVAQEILIKRESKDFTEKYGTVPMKVTVRFQEENTVEGARRAREAVEMLTASVPAAKVVTDVGQRELAEYYKRTGYLFEGCHVRPKLENASFKIEAADLGAIGAESKGAINGG
jgi:hypothetical protein